MAPINDPNTTPTGAPSPDNQPVPPIGNTTGPSQLPSSDVPDADGEPSTASSFASTPAVVSVRPANEPVSPAAPFVSQPKKSKKKLIIIAIVGALVLSLSAAGSAFAFWYNKPENVVLDALQKTIVSPAASVDGTFVATSTGESPSNVNIAYAFASNKDGESSGTADVSIKSDNQDDISLKTAFAASKDGNYYVKVENARDLLEQYLGMISGGDTDMFSGLINKLDNKWVVITNDDLEEFGQADDKESTCVQKAVKSYQTDTSQQKEIENIYRKNNFLVVGSLGTETVSARLSNHYEITIDEAKIKNFALALPDTRLFKAVDDCTEDDFAASWRDIANENNSTGENVATKFELWADVLNHEPTKIKVSVDNKDEEFSVVLNANTRLNQNTAVTIPKADTTVDDLRQETEKIETAYSESFEDSTTTQSFEGSGYTTEDSFNPAVLGLSILRQ